MSDTFRKRSREEIAHGLFLADSVQETRDVYWNELDYQVQQEYLLEASMILGADEQDPPEPVDTAEIDKVLCEVNGKVVLYRLNGELHAPFGLEGIAYYFETRGTPEDLYRPTEHVGYRYRAKEEREWEYATARYWGDTDTATAMDTLRQKGWQVEPVYVEVSDD